MNKKIKITQAALEAVKQLPKYKMEGKKYDSGKLRWDLFPWAEAEKIVEVLNFGAEKYGPNNWQQVEKGRDRYFAALQRHLVAWKKGEKTDKESSLEHLAHAGCCLLFLSWIDKNKKV